jgi:Tol biopolymer transport system component
MKSKIFFILISIFTYFLFTNCNKRDPLSSEEPNDSFKVLFIATEDTSTSPLGRTNLYSINDDGTSLETICNFYTHFNGKIEISPNGSKILLASRFIVNVDGSDFRTFSTPNYGDAKWKPNDSEIFTCSNYDGNNFDSEIYTINIWETDKIRLTNNEVDDYEPVWSFDGNYIYYTSNSGSLNRSKIWRMNHDGTEQTLFIDMPLSSEHFKFNYTGDIYSFINSGMVYSGNFSSSELTEHNIPNNYKWNPRSNTIAYINNLSEIILYDIETKQNTMLCVAPTDYYYSEFAWSPFGTKIVFLLQKISQLKFKFQIIDVNSKIENELFDENIFPWIYNFVCM